MPASSPDRRPVHRLRGQAMTAATPSEPVLSFRDPVAGEAAERPEHHRELRGKAKVHLDRPVPFLCVYRRPPCDEDTGAGALVTDEAAFLTSVSEGEVPEKVREFVLDTVCTFSPRFGGFLLLEVW